MRGKFVTFEGIEGCGKSTQTNLLAKNLRERGHTVLLTREPGGPPIGEAIRTILLNPDFTEMSPMTELLLYVAARHQHIEELIKPALAEGKIVLSDRYADSSFAYQGAARRLKTETLKEIHRTAGADFKPHLTFLFDLPPETGLKRVAARGSMDRFEKEQLHFHQKVREGYLDIAKKEPARVKIIPAEQNIDAVANAVLKEILEIL